MAMNVDELRTALLDMGESEAAVAAMKKSELQARYNQLSNTMDFDFVAETNQQQKPAECLQDMLPKYGTPEWQTYVLSQFQEDELVDGCPKCNGMRRIAQLVLGDIIESKATQVFVTGGEQRAVTVCYEITFDWKLNRVVAFGNLVSSGEYRVFGGLADCVEDSTIYGRHPAATAESKAEARALRKALALNVVTAEEKISGQDDEMPKVKDSAKITSALTNVLVAKITALKLDVNEVLQKFNKENSTKATVIPALSMEEGRKMLALLNTYQQAKA